MVLCGSSIMKGVTGHRDGRETFILLGCPSTWHVQEQAPAPGLSTVAVGTAGVMWQYLCCFWSEHLAVS